MNGAREEVNGMPVDEEVNDSTILNETMHNNILRNQIMHGDRSRTELRNIESINRSGRIDERVCLKVRERVVQTKTGDGNQNKTGDDAGGLCYEESVDPNDKGNKNGGTERKECDEGTNRKNTRRTANNRIGDNKPFYGNRGGYADDVRDNRGRYDRDARNKGSGLDESRRKYDRSRCYDDGVNYSDGSAVRNTRPYNGTDGLSGGRRDDTRNVKDEHLHGCKSTMDSSSLVNDGGRKPRDRKPFVGRDGRNVNSRSEMVSSSSGEREGTEAEYGTMGSTSKARSDELIMNKERDSQIGGNTEVEPGNFKRNVSETGEGTGDTATLSTSTFTSSLTDSLSNNDVPTKSTEQNHKNRMMRKLFKNLQLAEEKYGIDVLKEYKNIKRSDDVNEFKEMTWDSLGLDKRIIQALDSLGYKYPSPVQKQVLSTSRNNLVVRAKNGTGKTLAYLLPILNSILKSEENEKVKTIILVPTRELAMQVAKVAKRLATHFDKSAVLMPSYGGSNLYEDIIRIKAGIDGIISTPGRILDLIERQVLLLGSVNDVILDEADKLLSLEYKDTLRKILRNINYRKSVYNLRLFSATFPLPVNDFVERNMKNVLFINLMKESCLLALKQFYCCVKTEYKLHCLITLLRKVKYTQTIIFCNRTKTAELLAYRITELGYSCYFLSGKMTQDERNTIFYSFTNLKINILVSTDLTTRGIDVPGINLVINFDWPRTIESYLHRIGRAGRFGTKGISISLVGDDERKEVVRVESALSCELLPVSDPSFNEYCR
ncbi:hypothetical protein VCUG_01936 [Vavraia culicis subsp. floridensis]|uniref:RNA helicase n=1 Tax=Vavraia culicis (isolate floridensis) TaxID=948595 RepID=L2GTC9_VAVCU|nr:uncharacterized protein VCUG_01936 [Vavraia culicis subsp. floridensis]ELA46558.1 hypothetical protein VCUG_01936 [Vavraia culicis subsp. floridensis]